MPRPCAREDGARSAIPRTANGRAMVNREIICHLARGCDLHMSQKSHAVLPFCLAEGVAYAQLSRYATGRGASGVGRKTWEPQTNTDDRKNRQTGESVIETVLIFLNRCLSVFICGSSSRFRFQRMTTHNSSSFVSRAASRPMNVKAAAPVR